MDLDKYITERIDPQINWYDKKAGFYKSCFFIGNILVLIISAMIPFLTSFEANEYKYIIGFLGVSITIVTGVLNLFGFYQKWLLYRSTAEKLKSEKHLLNLFSDKLNDQEKIEYAKRLEQIILTENKRWLDDNNDKNTGTTNA
jgi:hypothetical protein